MTRKTDKRTTGLPRIPASGYDSPCSTGGTDVPDPDEPPAAPQDWPVLTMTERRVLGVLVEKSKTTPDTYPMSINALVTGCNQKSNRDPILDLSDVEVRGHPGQCSEEGSDDPGHGLGRVERWKHAMYDAWKVGKVEAAILTELLLRGPQTEGELRSRASRMEPIDDLDTPAQPC